MTSDFPNCATVEECREATKRREEFQSRLDQDDIAIFPSAPEQHRSHDLFHPYRQDSDFFYLTGFGEPKAILVLTATESRLYLRERKKEHEIWNGLLLGTERAPIALGVDHALELSQFDNDLQTLLSGRSQLWYSWGRPGQEPFDRKVIAVAASARARSRDCKAALSRLSHSGLLLHEMRLHKTPFEIERVRQAAKITAEGHLRLMREAAPAMSEAHLAALFADSCRRSDAIEGFTTIVAGGNRATILHYEDKKAILSDGELVLVDAGAEWQMLNADVSRTFPVNGKFRPEQRDLYQIVLCAHHRAIAAARPGATLDALHQIAIDTIIDGLFDLEILPRKLSRDEVVEKKIWQNFYMHKTSHWLGRDVHDVGSYCSAGQPRQLEPGMLFTIEPGIYLSSDPNHFDPSLCRDPRFLGIGIRLEDDILIGAEGCTNLTESIPIEIDDVEAACSTIA